MELPYLVTEDLEFLMRRWAERVGFSCPSSDFFRTLQQELLGYLRTIFRPLELIELADLSGKLQAAIAARAAGTIVVSIDQIYNQTPYHLECNRVADPSTCQIIGEAQRAGFPSLVEQIRALPDSSAILLVDDGCYSGGTLLRITELMRENGYVVSQVIVGIIIGRPGNQLLAKHPWVELVGVREYPAVVDWVCERDFYVGVPLSGRTAGRRVDSQVIPCEPEVALPYCLPFGDPISGASIPTDCVIDFSRFVLDQSIKLWQAVGECSGRPVLCRDVPRLPKGCTRDAQYFTEYLRDTRPSL
ncbi:MAG: phosphoribosyltransferase [Patescibacteria group bacterium]|nr:phosphoribosyltransferase [Patescibacteria group bacterium]